MNGVTNINPTAKALALALAKPTEPRKVSAWKLDPDVQAGVDALYELAGGRTPKRVLINALLRSAMSAQAVSHVDAQPTA